MAARKSMGSSVAATERVALSRLWAVGLATTVLVTVANLVIYGVTAAIFDGVRTWPLLSVGAVIVSSIAYLLAATLVYAGLGVLTRRPITTFRVVGVVALLLSFVPPLMAGAGALVGVPPADGPTVAALLLMHIVSGALTIGLFTTKGRAD